MAGAEPSSGAVVRRDEAVLTRSGAGCLVVWVRGEHDASTARELSATMARAVAAGGDVVLDLSGVEFMDAATVSVVLRTRELLRVRSRSVTVRSPSVRARRVLELCDVADLIDASGVEAVGNTGSPPDALGSWIARPATHRLNGRGAGPAPMPGGEVASVPGDPGGPRAPSSVIAVCPAVAGVASGPGGKGP
jgi:anti-anti-sigma factor